MGKFMGNFRPQNFMNVNLFKLKSDCVDKYFEVIDITSFEGMTKDISLKLEILITFC